MKKTATYWIEHLKLTRHPEGGYFREIYRSPEMLPGSCLPERFSGDHSFCTSIYFLLAGTDFSAFHRLNADEIWHFYTGAALTIYCIHSDGVLSQIFLGEDFESGELFQAVVPAGAWFAARLSREDSFALVGCTVAPGFEFEDFELGKRAELLRQFPQHRELIEQLTRE